MDKHELEMLVQRQVKGLDSYLDQIDYTEAVENAERETGWTLPTTSAEKINWLIERAKRHIFFMLMSESAHKFKVKQYSLHHRFDHYHAIIKEMDKKYEAYLEQLPIDPDVGIAIGGTKIDAGFQYEEDTGEDLTYGEDNLVIFTPTEND
jgi:hypothetical protein